MRYGNKSYWKIPFGEIQYGHITGTLSVWFRRKCYTLRKGQWPK